MSSRAHVLAPFTATESETIPAVTTWDYVIVFEPKKAKRKAIRSRCSAKHDGQPDKVRGCGQLGHVNLNVA